MGSKKKASTAVVVKPKMGRPTVITEVVTKKLHDMMKLDVTTKTACNHAGISPEVFYTECKRNPDFKLMMNKGREYARIKAGQVVQQSIIEDENVETAKWYLEKKHPDEFGGSNKGWMQQINIDNKDMKIEFIEDLDIKDATKPAS